MRRGRRLLWTVVGGVVAAVAIVVALIHVNFGTSPHAASSPAPPASASAPQAGASAPVVIPAASSTSSLSYLSDLKSSEELAGTVTRGPVELSGSIYPKSISFYCNVGDPTAFPVYRLGQDARRFQATIGLPAKSPPRFRAGILLVGDGRTVRMFSVSVRRPKTVDVDVAGVHALQLECFGSGNSATGGEAVAVAWGNARVSGGRS